MDTNRENKQTPDQAVAIGDAANLLVLLSQDARALDIVEAERGQNTIDVEIVEILPSNGAVTSRPPSAVSPGHHGGVDEETELKDTKQRKKAKKKLRHREWVEKMRNGLMVVASMIATMTYQAIANPPVTLWEAAKEDVDVVWILVCQTVGFHASLLVLLLLISGLPFRRKAIMWLLILVMWVAISSVALSYWVSLSVIKAAANVTNLWRRVDDAAYFCIGLHVLLALGHIISLILKVTKHINKKRAAVRNLVAAV